MQKQINFKTDQMVFSVNKNSEISLLCKLKSAYILLGNDPIKEKLQIELFERILSCLCWTKDNDVHKVLVPVISCCDRSTNLKFLDCDTLYSVVFVLGMIACVIVFVFALIKSLSMV